MTIQEVRQSEEVKAQVNEQDKTKWRPPQRENSDSDNERDQRKCGRCGKAPHSQKYKCPARKSTWNRCGKRGHWVRVCKSKLVREVTEAEGHEQYYLGSVNGTPQDDDDWTVTLNIANRPVVFKIYTSADCSIISEKVLKTLKPKRVTDNKESTEWSRGVLNCLGALGAHGTSTASR